MKKTGIFLFTFLVCTQITAGVSLAQVDIGLVVGKVSAQTITPTPTQKTIQPTTNPTPEATQVPSPTTAVTVTQAPQDANTEPTKSPAQVQQTQETGPTATPTPVPPTPTPKVKPVILPIKKNPPEQPLAQMITAPFDLVVNALPYDYYNDQGLAPETTKVLLAFAFFCLLTGTILLNWPSLVRTVRSLSAPKVKVRKSFPYVTDRALTK